MFLTVGLVVLAFITLALLLNSVGAVRKVVYALLTVGALAAAVLTVAS